MEQDFRENIFKSFEQADASTTREYGGTGLGLSICKQLVSMMDGELSVETENGVGSVFCFTARFGVVANQNKNKKFHYQSLENKRILIVDNEVTVRRITMAYLKEAGAYVEEATNGEEAIGIMMKNGMNQNPFDLIIVDYVMPNMDGVEFAKIVMNNKGLEESRFILLTAFSQKGDAKYFYEQGFHGYLTKPVRKSELLNTISIVLNIVPNTMTQDEIVTVHLEKEVKRTQMPRILVVEDSLVNQKVIVQLLQKEGCICDVALNGEEAYKAWEKQSYDIIFMDCQMPVLDGYEATRRIRDNEKDEHVRIVAMTAYVMEGDAEKCYQAGMDDYLSKPIKFDKVIELLEEIHVMKEGRDNGIE